MKEDEKHHHFLYYIFQFDSKCCKMNAEKEACLQAMIRKAIALIGRGE